MKKLILSGVLLACSMFVTTAQAAVCDVDTTSGSNLNTSDVTFRVQNSDACAGQYPGIAGSGNDNEFFVNQSLQYGDWAGDPWQEFLKSDSQTTSSLFGVNWTLSADNDQKEGDWILTVVDDSLGNLPITLDLLVVLKSGNTGWVGYRFDDEEFSSVGANNGTFKMKVLNNGGQIAALSHLSLYAREVKDQDFACTIGDTRPECQLPEPSQLALLGIGLFAMGGMRKFRQ